MIISFVSVNFILFVILVFFLYFTIPIKWRWVVLLLASIVFYCYAGIQKVLFVLGTCMIAFFTTRNIEKIYNGENPNRKKAKLWLVAGVVLIVFMMLYAKIAYAVYEALDQIFLFSFDLKVIVPLGISYYTFSVIGYMADVFWKKEKAEHNYFKLLLYMIYFPHILQGPISRHGKLASQLVEGHRFNYKNMCYGLQRAVWGYFKKMVIADRLAMLTSEVFSNYTRYEGLYLVIAAICATIELYCDFSGCMDIAIGISESMSIRLDENFERPFYSRSAAEFWRRWHITLGTWFKDYIYMPLVVNPKFMKFCQKMGKRFGKPFAKNMMSIIPLVVVWILTGLWHNFGLNYIVWGCYWGGIIIISTIFATQLKSINKVFRINTNSKYWHAFQTVRTFCLFCISRLIIVPNDLSASLEIIQRIFMKFNIWILFDQTLYGLGLVRQDFWVGVLAIIILWKVSSMQAKGVCVRDKIAEYPIVFRWSIYYMGIMAVLIFGIYGSGHAGATFTYMQY